MSLFRIELGKDDLTPFVGLNNYLVRLPLDDEVLAAIPRTLFFAAMSTAITLPLALVTALVLNRGFRGVSIFFMALLMPWAVASIVAGIFWRSHLRHPLRDRERRPLGLGLIGPAVQLAGEHGTSRRHRPGGAIVAVRPAARRPAAGRAEDHPAARCTARRRWTAPPRGRRFRFITLPAIKTTLIVVGVLQVIIGLQVFDLLYSLTSGGPGRDTYVLIYAIYDIAFGRSASATARRSRSSCS